MTDEGIDSLLLLCKDFNSRVHYSFQFDCGGMILEEAPGKLAESLRLFLQGFGYGESVVIGLLLVLASFDVSLYQCTHSTLPVLLSESINIYLPVSVTICLCPDIITESFNVIKTRTLFQQTVN